jgi:hypothetical protein
MVAETKSLTPDEVRVIAARDGDLSHYAKAIHNYEIEPYQEAWDYALDNEDRVCIVCPPDTYKSTTVQMNVERAIGRDPNSRTLWLMNSGEQAQKRVMSVSSTIKQNRTYKKAFKVDEDKDAQWTNTVLYVKRTIDSPDPTLMASGLNGPYQGLHFDRIVIDDPTNQEDPRSPTTMELQRSKLRGVILDRLVEGGRIVVILTRWGENDLVPLLEELGFRILTFPVIADDYPWGPTISNKRFPLDRCELLRRDKGEVLWNLTYMCDPQAASTGNLIQRENIKIWTPDSLPDNATLTLMAVDPASGQKSWNDPSAIGVSLLDPKTRSNYITDMIVGRWNTVKLEEEILKRATRIAGLVAVGIETVAFQMSLLQNLRRSNRHIPFRELPYRTKKQAQSKAIGLDRDKTNRAIYLNSVFASNRMFLPPYPLPMVDGVTLLSELISFPNGKHDDRMDVCSFLAALADTYTNRGQKVKIKI